MNWQEGIAFALIGTALVMFAWGRFRYDLVSLAILAAGILLGVVKPAHAFDGFKNEIVVIIGAALVVSTAVSRSGVVEALLRPITPYLKTEQAQVPALAVSTTLLSMVTKNVGALAIFLPAALRLTRTTPTPASRLFMPMSFASLLGGIVTLVGTSPNIIVSQVRGEMLGKPFAMFDFAPVGLTLAGLGVAFVSVAYRLLPKERVAETGPDAAIERAPYLTEAVAPGDYAHGLEAVAELHKRLGQDVAVVGLTREGAPRAAIGPDARIEIGDVLQIEGEPSTLQDAIARAGLRLTRADSAAPKSDATEEVRSAEAVVTTQSELNGRSARQAALFDRLGINVLAISRVAERLRGRRLKDVPLRAGDVLVLQGGAKALPRAMKDLGLLPLAERDVRLGATKPSFLPIAVLAVFMVLVALKLLPVAQAFFCAAVLMVLLGSLSMREAYESLDPPVLVLIAALAPISEAVRESGGTAHVAVLLSHIVGLFPPLGALMFVMTAAMLLAPFLHNVPTVLMLAPIAVDLARRLHLSPDAFLMGVATGAACDFLTPVGHQCNTLVWGPGGYRFTDYARLGAPLSVLVIALGAPLISAVWGLHLR